MNTIDNNQFHPEEQGLQLEGLIKNCFPAPSQSVNKIEVDFLAVSDEFMKVLKNHYNLVLVDWFYHIENKYTGEIELVDGRPLRIIPEHALNGLCSIVSINETLHPYTNEEGQVYDLRSFIERNRMLDARKKSVDFDAIKLREALFVAELNLTEREGWI